MTIALNNIIALMRIISTSAGINPLRPILIGMAKIPTPNRLPAINKDAGTMAFQEIVAAEVFDMGIYCIRILFFFMFFMLQLRAGQNRYDTTLAAPVFQQLRAAWITRCKIWLTFSVPSHVISVNFAFQL